LNLDLVTRPQRDIGQQFLPIVRNDVVAIALIGPY